MRQCPQRYLERQCETSGSGSSNGARCRSRKRESDEFYGFARKIGEPRGKTRMFKRLNRVLQSGEIIRLHAVLVLQVGRNFAAIRNDPGNDLFVKPNVHGGGVVGIAGIVKLLRKLLACVQTG